MLQCVAKRLVCDLAETDVAVEPVAKERSGPTRRLYQHLVTRDDGGGLVAAGGLDDAKSRVGGIQCQQVAAPALMGIGHTQSSHYGGDYIHLGADNIDPLAKFFLHPRGNQQQRHVIAIKIHIRQLLGRAKTVIADHDKQCLVVIRQLFCPLEELTQRPVGIAHGCQVLIEVIKSRHRCNRQLLRQRVGRVVGQGLQQRVERPVTIVLLQFARRPREHILIRYPPGGIGKDRVDEILPADVVPQALVAKKTRLVVPGEVAVVDIQVCIPEVTQQLRQPGKMMRPLGLLHQVFQTREVGEARHGSEHTLVGVGAIGEKPGKQQALPTQRVEMWRDITLPTQRADIVSSETFHQDNDDIFYRQGTGRTRTCAPADRGGFGVDKLLIRGQQHSAHSPGCVRTRQGCAPDIGAPG